MSDIRHYINLVESARNQELDEVFGKRPSMAGRQPAMFVNKERQLGKDFYGDRVFASITLNRRDPAYSTANIMVDHPRDRDCLAIVKPAKSNPTADPKQAWVVTPSYSEQFHHLKTGEHPDMITACKSVVDEYKALQREEYDERNYGRPGFGKAKFDQFED